MSVIKKYRYISLNVFLRIAHFVIPECVNRESRIIGLSILFGLILLSISGCSRDKSFSNVDELEKYVKGPDWKHMQSITRNGVKASLRYLPSEALLINYYRRYEELKNALINNNSMVQKLKDSLLSVKKEEIKRTKEIYDNSIYFSMTIGYEDPKRDIEYDKMKEGFNEYSAWMQKLVFSMREYIYLDSPSAGEVPLALYDMQRTYGITKDRTFMLVFPRKYNEVDLMSSSDKEITVWLKEFGLNTGNLSFCFSLPFERINYLLV